MTPLPLEGLTRQQLAGALAYRTAQLSDAMVRVEALRIDRARIVAAMNNPPESQP